MTTEQEQFLAAVKEYQDDWAALDVRAIAVQGNDGDWHLRALRVVLLPARPTKTLAGPSTELLWTAHEILPLTELERLISGVANGAIRIAGKDLVLKQENQNRISMGYQKAIQDTRYSAHRELPSSAHTLGTKSNHQFGIDHWRADRLESELQRLDPPWEDYHDVIVNFLDEKQFEARIYDIAIHFIAPVGVTLSEVRYDGLSVEGAVKGTRRTTESKVRLAVIEHRAGGSIQRSQVKLIKGKGGGWKFEHPLQSDTVRTVVMLTYGSMRAGYWTRLVPRASAASWARAVEHFLPGKDVLQDGLLNPEIRGKNLEPWAALLFSRLGFHTINLGRFPGDLPDLVAEGPSGEILLIECTEDSPDSNDKLGKLSQRSRRLEAALDIEVQPVILTRSAMETIPETHKAKAREEGISLVAREQLLELGERTVQTADAKRTLDFLQSCIPLDMKARSFGRRRGLGFL
jgi:hypothetical protein